MSVKINSSSSYAVGSVQKIKSSVDGAPVLKKETEAASAQYTDTVEISDWAKALQEMKEEKEGIKSMMEDAAKQSESAGGAYDDFGKALEIFRRISHGDHVPAEDERFLMEYSSDLYLKAKSLQMNNEDPKDYDSILDDEDGSDTSETGESQDMAAPSGQEASVPDASGASESIPSE